MLAESRAADCNWLVPGGLMASVARCARWDVPLTQTGSSHWITTGVCMVVTINNQPESGCKSDIILKLGLGLLIFHTNS